MRILIGGASRFSRSGYGQIVRNISPALRARGHEIAEFGTNGQTGTRLEIDGVPLFPRGMTDTDALGYYVELWRPDWVLWIGDPWTTPGMAWDDIRRRGTRLAMWFPVQAAPMHPYFAEVIGVADAAIAFTRWGAEVAELAGVACESARPGVDPAVYCEGDRKAARAWLEEAVGISLADRYVIGMVAANVQTLPADRKGWGPLFMALARLRKTSPELRPLVYAHTFRGNQAGGMDLPWLAEQAGVFDDVVWAPDGLFYEGLTDAQMATLYRSFDVLAAPSRAEGFGLPIVEAQACGTYVVATGLPVIGEIIDYGITVRQLRVEPCDGIAGGMTAVVDWIGFADALFSANERRLESPMWRSEAVRHVLSWDRAAAELEAILG